MKWNDLTREQQEFLLELDREYPMPDGATHFDIEDNFSTSWMKLDEEDGVYLTATEGDRYCAVDAIEALMNFIPIPDKPWYDPKDISFKQEEPMQESNIGKWFRVDYLLDEFHGCIGECIDEDESEVYLAIPREGSHWFKLECVREEANKVEPTPEYALDTQIGGNHYKECGIQPIEYIQANNLDYFQGNVVKYATRHKDKNGSQDIRKAIHYLELILEMQYKEKV